MQHPTLVAVLAGLGMLPATPAFAQVAGFADPAAIDAEVAAFTGAATGAPGGARAPVDRRLRVAACGLPLQLAWHGRGAGMVRVECNGASPWRVFVAVNAAGTAQPASTAAAPQIARGQVLTITLQGRGFAISQQAQALEAGRVGEWIRVRPEGSSEEVRARIDSPVRAIIPLHG
jgi:flagella basal body P-ring formation protein FlgA